MTVKYYNKFDNAIHVEEDVNELEFSHGYIETLSKGELNITHLVPWNEANDDDCVTFHVSD